MKLQKKCNALVLLHAIDVPQLSTGLYDKFWKEKHGKNITDKRKVLDLPPNLNSKTFVTFIINREKKRPRRTFDK